jgi:type 1 glutamine amidotransferase
MRRVALCLLLTPLVLPGLSAGGRKADDRKPHVVFVTGDCEYRSEITMPMIARILEAKHGMKCSVCYAVDPKTDKVTPKFLKNIKGLEALKTADLVVFELRYRQLPDDQLKLILDYVDSGKPIVGLRTSTHAFRYTEGDNRKYNDGFGREVFGQKWISHHGHDSSTNVTVTEKDHPITRGVKEKFHCRSWLYNVTPLVGDCKPLAVGDAVKGEKADGMGFGQRNPVAWTKTHKGGRVFFTTLGHPKDFEEEPVRRLLINGIYWALGREKDIPAGGCNVEIQGEYVAPPTTRAVPDPTLQGNPETRYARQDEGNPQGQE